MAKFYYGKDISTMEDVRNLINGIVFRQMEPFTKEDIIEKLMFYLTDSSIKISKCDIDKMVEYQLDALMIYDDDISLCNGTYTWKKELS